MDNKQVLRNYVDACELVKETEEDIAKLKKKRGWAVSDSVKGPMQDFSYASQSFHIEGTEYTYQDDAKIREEEKLLIQRKEYAEQIKMQAQQLINCAPVRIQRIIRFRCIQRLPWKLVAEKIGNGATEDSIKKEYQRYMNGN
ncbi:Uncharacterised protein [uncultured Roseburia sp.]|uniref:RNA polymerase subunit sigma-70 n=1 Tax=Brotonthovivens ammoniilytica TaxID=2981725 RepID=A0ABT2TJ89_9FIRM|nr:RNA polymerase subunit sigma-70 [Brotonthovivens ammoniilytica]MCU6762277.1 RNA polymerase subunit sigma-70 [Brotonthovivens ammoniilytica]SCI61045.1 Uncharacterised protein [uncultured Roseburia sp.]